MAIITISRGSYSKGRQVAEFVAKRLGYGCISRDLLLEASAKFNIPEIKLIRALHDAPSILEKFSHGREEYLAYFAVALLERVQRDNIVYHGLAGHFYLQGIRHVLNVRILSDMEDRIQLEMERENINRDEAQYILEQDDKERRQWSLRLFGVDTWDPSLYDLVINIRKMTVNDAVDLICRTVNFDSFSTTEESNRKLDDLLQIARVKAVLVATYPRAEVTVANGKTLIELDSMLVYREKIERDIRKALEPLDLDVMVNFK